MGAPFLSDFTASLPVVCLFTCLSVSLDCELSTDTCFPAPRGPGGLSCLPLALQVPASHLFMEASSLSFQTVCLCQAPGRQTEMSLACLSGMSSGSTPAEGEGRTQEWTEGVVGFYMIPKTSSAHLMGSSGPGM